MLPTGGVFEDVPDTLDLALAATGRKADLIVGFVDVVLAAVFKNANWIVSLSPSAVFAMMLWIFAV